MKSSSIAIAVLLGLSGTTAAAAEPIRLAQTFAADVIPPYEVFTIIRSMGMRPLGRPHYRGRFYVVHAVDPRGEEVRVVVDAYAARVVSVRPLDRQAATEYDRPNAYRRYDPPGPAPRVIEGDPRYMPPAAQPRQPDPRYAQPPRQEPADPRFSAPQAAPDDDDDEMMPGNQPDEFDAEEDDSTGSLQPRDTPRSIGAPRVPPAVAAPATRSAVVTPPKTPLPRPRPDQLASASPADKPQAPAVAPASDAKVQDGKPAETKADVAKEVAKTEAPKPGVRIIEIKKPEPRI